MPTVWSWGRPLSLSHSAGKARRWGTTEFSVLVLRQGLNVTQAILEFTAVPSCLSL